MQSLQYSKWFLRVPEETLRYLESGLLTFELVTEIHGGERTMEKATRISEKIKPPAPRLKWKLNEYDKTFLRSCNIATR